METIQRPPADELFQFISLHKEDKLLDLGAGVGYISLPISKYVDEVIAIEFDEDILKYLETKAREHRMTNIKTLVSDFKDIQLDDEKVDKAVASISLHEVKPLVTFPVDGANQQSAADGRQSYPSQHHNQLSCRPNTRNHLLKQ